MSEKQLKELTIKVSLLVGALTFLITLFGPQIMNAIAG